MQYDLECLEPKVFNWCEAVFPSMKEQLTKVKKGKTNFFGYGSILISFALERIPFMQPQHISLGVPGPRDPQMQRWVDLMAKHAGQSLISFTSAFCEWFDHQDMTFTEYPYSRMDFCGDPDLMLLVGA